MFEKTVDFKDYFPGFVDEGVKRRETREAVEEILVLLSDDELFSVRMVQKLTRLIRQLNQFEDAVFIRFVGRGERVRIIQSVWDVVQNKQVTMSTRVRFANILASHLSSYKKLYLRPWWHGGFVSQVDLEAGPASPEFRCGCGEGFAEERPGARDENCLCGLIGLSQIVRLIEDEFTRGYLEGLTTNHQKVKNYVSSLARVLNAYRPYVREEELDEFVRRWLSLSTSSYSFFVYSKLFVLACSPYYSFRLVESGRIFEIWEVLNGQFVSHWDSAMVTVISRGVRYSWRVGRSLDCLYQKIPYLFQVLYINLGIPILHNLVSNSVNTGATCSNSSVSSGAASSQVLQTKAPSVIKEIISNELLSALTVKPVNLFNKFAIVFTHLLKSLRHLQSPESLETAERVKAIPDSLVNLVSIIYPLNHPSNIGKWSHGISIFVQALTYQFCKRIYRERVLCRSEAIAPAQRESVLQASLCRFDDEYLMSILFPLIEQGIYSKDVQVAGRYEDALKRWTYILPDVLLSFLLNVKIMPALEGDTETHQVYIAFRILTTVVPIVIHFTPQELPKFLQISLQGIDISDPMKINQTLFFLTVLFYNLQNFQVESLDFDEYEAVEELSSSLQSGGEAGLLRSYYTLYNYPTHSIPISDRSLRSRKDLPREILDQTDIGGQCPLDFYFKQGPDGEFEVVADEEARRDFYFVPYGKFDRETLLSKFQQRRLLLDSIFGYWIMDFLERVLNLLENVVKPSEAGSYSSSVDLGISYALRALVISVFSKCKQFGCKQLLRDCYEMIGDWVCKNYIPDNYKHLSKILSAMGACDPELSFEMVLSKLLLKIKAGSEYCRLVSEESSSRLGSDGAKFLRGQHDLESEDESFILYYANLISSLIRYTRDHLLSKANRAYYFGVYSLAVGLLLDPRKKIKRAGIKLQQRFIESLVHIQILEPPPPPLAPTAQSPESTSRGVLLWGLPFYLQEEAVFSQVLEPVWFVPPRACLLEVKSLIVFNHLLILRLLGRLVPPDSEHSALLDASFRAYQQLLEESIRDAGSGAGLSPDHAENFRVLLELVRTRDLGGPFADQMASVFFCLNSLRLLSKSVACVLPIVRSECPASEARPDSSGESPAQDDPTPLLLGLTLSPDSFQEFEPFFSRYYSDTHRLILLLVQVFSGVRIVQLAQPSLTYYQLQSPLSEISTAEEIRFKSKVIKAINQSLNRYYSSTSSLSLSSLYNTDFSDSVMAWLSYTNGLFHQSSLLNTPKIFWLKNIQYYWNKRINMRRHEYGFFGSRRQLIYLITLFSLGNYSLVRKAAQTTLKDSVNSHVSSRSCVLQFILFEVYFSVLLFTNSGRLRDAQDSDHEFDRALRSNIEFVRSSLESQGDQGQNPLEEFLFNHLSGLSHIIVGNSSYHRFLWNNLDLLVGFVVLISNSSSLKLSKETVPVRLLSAFGQIMANRDFDSLLDQYLSSRDSRAGPSSERSGGSLETKLSRLLGLLGPPDGLDMVSQMVSGSMQRDLADPSYVIELARIFIRHLSGARGELFASHSFLRRSLVSLTFVQGVVLTLVSRAGDNSWADSSSIEELVSDYWRYLWGILVEPDRSGGGSFYALVFFSVTTLMRQLFEQDRARLADLAQRESDFVVQRDRVRSLLENMVNIAIYSHQISGSHSSSSQTGLLSSRTERKTMNSTNTSMITNSLILNYTHVMSSFPYHRFKCYTGNLSLTSVMFFQLVIFMFKTRWEGGSPGDNMLEVVLDTVLDWCATSTINLEKEKHFLILEILAAVFSSCTLSRELDDFLSDPGVLDREKVLRVLFHEFQQSDQDFIFNYMDFIKFSLTPARRLNLRYYFAGPEGDDGRLSPRDPHWTGESSTLGLLLEFVLDPFGLSRGGRRTLETETEAEAEAEAETDTERSDLSTFEVIKYLRIYQSALMELVMNESQSVGVSPGLRVFLERGLDLFASTLHKDNNYKQLREEMSNMLHCLTAASNLIYSRRGPEGVCGADDDWRRSLVGRYGAIVDGLQGARSDTEAEAGARAAVSRSEIVLYYCLLRDLYSDRRSGLGVDEMVSFETIWSVIAGLQRLSVSDEVAGISYGSLMSLLISQLNHAEVPIVTRLARIIHDAEKLDPASHKARLLRVRVNTIVGEFYSPLVNGTPLQLEIVNNIVHGLFEDQSEIKHAAKLALCTLFRALPSSWCVVYIRLFRIWIGRAVGLRGLAGREDQDQDQEEAALRRRLAFETSAVPPQETERFFRAGILGTISAILSHPFDVPFWLPETITFLANCSGARSVSQISRKQIQECIQEFFKTHQDGWNFIHKYKFNSSQLETLDTYKGRPAYFT